MYWISFCFILPVYKIFIDYFMFNWNINGHPNKTRKKKKQNMSKSICYFSYRCVSYTIFVIIFFSFIHILFFREFLALGQTIFFYQMNSRRSKKEKNWNKNIIRHSLYIFFALDFLQFRLYFEWLKSIKKILKIKRRVTDSWHYVNI